MKRGLIINIFIILSLILLGSVYAVESVDAEIKKLTHYAEEYEAGNIDYVGLLVYAGAIRENLNEIIGVVDKREGEF